MTPAGAPIVKQNLWRRLTETEWMATIEFLAAAGHITDGKRQEFILLSDILGITMQTIAVNDEQGEKVLKMIETLTDNDDVQNVYANFDVSDALVSKMSA